MVDKKDKQALSFYADIESKASGQFIMLESRLSASFLPNCHICCPCHFDCVEGLGFGESLTIFNRIERNGDQGVGCVGRGGVQCEFTLTKPRCLQNNPIHFHRGSVNNPPNDLLHQGPYFILYSITMMLNLGHLAATFAPDWVM